MYHARTQGCWKQYIFLNIRLFFDFSPLMPKARWLMTIWLIQTKDSNPRSERVGLREPWRSLSHSKGFILKYFQCHHPKNENTAVYAMEIDRAPMGHWCPQVLRVPRNGLGESLERTAQRHLVLCTLAASHEFSPRGRLNQIVWIPCCCYHLVSAHLLVDPAFSGLWFRHFLIFWGHIPVFGARNQHILSNDYVMFFVVSWTKSWEIPSIFVLASCWIWADFSATCSKVTTRSM